MRKVIKLVILVPLAVLFVVFAVANRQQVTVSLDPFSSADPSLTVSVPLFLLVLAVAILGVVVGGSATWFGQRHWRRRVRRCQRDLDQARDELMRSQPARPGPRASAADQFPVPTLSVL